MIITTENELFWVSDDVVNNENLTVAEVKAQMIPFVLYEAQQKVLNLQEELDYLNNLPDEVLVPNEEKNKIPEVEEQLIKAQQILSNLNGNNN